MRYLLILFFSISSLAMEASKIAERLTYTHGPEWNKIIEHKSKIKSFLWEVVKDPSILSQYDYDESYIEDIKRVSLSELGHFVSQDDEDFESFKKIYQDKVDQDFAGKDTTLNRDLIATLHGINNTGSVWSAEYLMGLYESSNNLYKSVIIDFLNDNFSGGEENSKNVGDYEASLAYQPHIRTPIYERSGDWEKLLKNYRVQLSKTYKSGSNKDLKVQATQALRLADKVFHSNQNSLDQRVLSQTFSIKNQKVAKTVQRAVASDNQDQIIESREASNNTESESNNNSWLLIFLTLIGLFFGLYLFKRFK